MIGVGRHLFRRKDGASHFEGREYPGLHEALPALAADLLDDATGDDVHQAVVPPLRVRGAGGLEEPKAAVERITREWRLVPEEIMPR